MWKKIGFFVFSFLFISSTLASVTVFKNSYHISSIQWQDEFYHAKMAHPALTINTVNVDANQQVLLNFNDIFTNPEKALKILSTYCELYFNKKISTEKMPSETLKILQDMIKQATAPQLKNYQHWNIDGDYLKITFDEAQVLPRYYGAQTVAVPLSLLATVLNPKIFPDVFQLKTGDLLFQDLNCGQLCDGINSTTYGVDHATVSHVGMVVSVNGDEPQVIEAISAGVMLTPLDQFLLRSEDVAGHPRVMVGRVDEQVKNLIPAAVKAALHDLHASYNATFSPNGPGFYCSQLVTQSFFEANHDQPVFEMYPMNFKEEESKNFPTAWIQYFADLKQPIPQGEMGSNPGQLSRDPKIHVIYFYGELRSAIS